MIAVKGNMCVFNNRYCKNKINDYFERVTGLYLLSLSDDNNIQSSHNRLNDDLLIKEIKEY